MFIVPGSKNSNHGMTRGSQLAIAAVAAAVAGFASHASAAIVLNDTFGSGSTVNSSTPAAPTASSASYEVAGTKNDTGSSASTIASGDLSIKQVSTTSGVIETQALFTSTPVTLATAGDSIDFRMTFTNTNVGIAGNADTLYFGLYNSGSPSSGPLTTLQNAGLSATVNTGGAGVAGWQGYVSQISPASTTSTGKVITRPAQTSGTFADQDLVANGASGGTFANPVGATISPNFINASAAGIANSSVYTEDLSITLNSDGSQTIATNLYAGAGIGGTNILSQTVSTTTPLISSFDGLAFGWRYSSGTKAVSSLDVSALSVNSSIAGNGGTTPEPASLSILALGGVGLLARRRKA